MPWTPQPCTLKEYPELLAFLDLAFAKPQKRWFARHLNNIFRPEPAVVSRTFVVHDKGKIVGATGAYPFTIRVAGVALSVGGIGSVSCHPDYRGRGVMSALLAHCIAVMEREGFDVSWLGGDRFRYRNYGWDFGGREMSFSMHDRDIRKYHPDLKPASYRTVTARDLPVLKKMFRKFPAGAVRSDADWRLRLKSEKWYWALAAHKGKQAYIACHRSNPKDIAEIQGEGEAILPALLAHMKKHGVDTAWIKYPDAADAASQALFSVATSFNLQHRAQMRIVNVDGAWKKLLPVMKRQMPRQLAAGLGKVDGAADRKALLDRAIGFYDSLPVLPARLKRFEALKPVGWWLSPVDEV